MLQAPQFLKSAIYNILNVSDRVRFRRFVDGHVISYNHVPISDYGDTHITCVMHECFAVIDEARAAGKNILVHCQGGVNRSPTIVIAYLLYNFRWDLQTCLDYVRERHSMTSPHELYMKQLIECEMQLLGKITVDICEYSRTSIQGQLRNLRATFSQSGNTTDTAVLEDNSGSTANPLASRFAFDYVDAAEPSLAATRV